ncbi:MAG: DNA mismatch repair protein MutS [Chloroflexi bacterium]|nr:DNA mismatch repair protein MutS [Chloroflexota bacterium]
MTTPLRRQYLEVKKKYPDVVVFFRLGDFYETYDEDARMTARELEITLTSREMGKGHRIPMSGFPCHAVDGYLARLIQKGHKVAICDQLTQPDGTRALVERDVVRVVTPGTVVEPNLLQSRSNNYLAALVLEGERAGLAYADITTSEYAATQLPIDQAASEISRLKPSELLVPTGIDVSSLGLAANLTTRSELSFDFDVAEQALKEHFGVLTLDGFGCAGQSLAVRAAGAVLGYLGETQKKSLSLITTLATYSVSGYMGLDPQTVRNLELFQTSLKGEKSGSLLWVLDQCRTSMGSRLLRRWMGQPLLDISHLQRRQDAIEWFFRDGVLRQRAEAMLKDISDLERLVNRVRVRLAQPRELIALKRSLEAMPALKQMLGDDDRTRLLASRIKPCEEVAGLIGASIKDEPPGLLSDGGVIREGFSDELDRLRDAGANARQYLANLERQERERTGIRSLKVGYNRVFGYYIEVSRSYLEKVPENYIRKQTLTDAERFLTPELKEYESLILSAQERTFELEGNLYRQVCQQISLGANQVLATAAAVAEVDVLAGLARVAVENGYVRPELEESGTLRITAGRHPVVERSLGPGRFVPNDVAMSTEETQIVVLTGPNMAGKSTYLRQVALIALMAQIGSFVPADRAVVGIADRIFARIGLQDDLATGRSTFMVEMIETANILNNATPRSLVILDEIGRGTSTYDGLSIARAVVEYIHNHPQLRSRTIFATHYHEMVTLAGVLSRVKNFNVAVTEEKGQVVFLRKIVPGGADKSYGIHVAQLAGLPRSVTRRAGEIMAGLERNAGRGRTGPARRTQREELQLTLISPRPQVIDDLLNLDIQSTTPLEAINMLYELQKKAADSK